MTRGHRDEQSRVFCELSALVFSLLRSPPPPIPALRDGRPPLVPVPPYASPCRRSPEITPAGMGMLLLGISLALMLCGSVTFFIGFMLMPWVLGFLTVLYVAGVLSTISALGRSILCFAMPHKDVPEWKLL